MVVGIWAVRDRMTVWVSVWWWEDWNVHWYQVWEFTMCRKGFDSDDFRRKIDARW